MSTALAGLLFLTAMTSGPAARAEDQPKQGFDFYVPVAVVVAVLVRHASAGAEDDAV